MPRTTPPDRVAKLLDEAAAVFVEHGFHRTQMDDIAERLGVSKGTIYRAVDSKETLFAAVIAWADSPERLPDGGIVPGAGIAEAAPMVSRELAAAIDELELTAIVVGRTRLRPSTGVGEEVERITADLHRVMRSRRTAIMVLDRCAGELPGVSAVWFGDGRYALVDLWHRYLTLRSGHLTVAVDTEVLARTIVEIVTTWAVKMPWDPSPRPYPEDTAEACAVMIRSLVAGPAR